MFQILVVEDDASLRRLMSAALKQNGYQPFTANDGVEALDMLEKTNIDELTDGECRELLRDMLKAIQ